jgi:hypothetical protein
MTVEQLENTTFGELKELLGEPRGQMLIDGYFKPREVQNLLLAEVGEQLITQYWENGLNERGQFFKRICSPLITE